MSTAVVQPQGPAPPQRIGRYRVIERIGKGSMGVVYSAHDELMGRDVAVKVMMTDLEGEPEIRARFTREAQVCAKLAHPNIVTVYDIDEDENGRLFIVMELLRGQTLGECLKRGTLSIEEKVDLILEVCEGLAVASAAGVCHRDIKPGNLFLKSDGGVKILDFGIARLASSSMTASGYIVGTPDFMSPEQARGIAIDERSDIFSVAAVLYLLLARRKPFLAPDLPAVLHRVVSEEPAPIGPAEAPPELAQIVFKALAKDPNQRFQSFPELSGELAQWRRRYEGETRGLAEEAATSLERLWELAADERRAADALGVPPESDVDVWLSDIAAGYPELLSMGADALRLNPWYRSHVEEIVVRISSVMTAWEPRIANLRAAAEDLATATRQLEAGDARTALSGLESVLRKVPSAGIQEILERARQTRAEQQARDDRVRSLLGDAAAAISSDHFEAAVTLASEAVREDPENLEARDFLMRAQQQLKTAESAKLRLCEKCLERARRAMQLEQLEEAERQLALARETAIDHPDIPVVTSALVQARAARETADAVIQEIAGELAAARVEFQKGDRQAALDRLDALVSRHPSSAAAQTELARLRAHHERLLGAERTVAEAERLATSAADALAKDDNEAAARLSDDALALVPGHVLALKTSAMAHARQRERADRKVRADHARRLVENATTLLARGRPDRAIKEARRAAELDPTSSAAPGVIAEAFRRQAEAAAAEFKEQENAKRRVEVRDALQSAVKALRSKEFTRARMLAERAVALDPDSSAAKELIAKIAAAVALAALDDDETADLQKGPVDPDATVAAAVISEGSIWRWILAVRLWLGRLYGSALRWARLRFDTDPVKRAGADVSTGAEAHNKES